MSRSFDLPVLFKGANNIIGDIDGEIMSDLQNMAATLSTAVYNMGVNYANQRLNSTREDYLNNFEKIQVDDSSFIIRLNPPAMHIDDGYSSFDLKPGILNGPKAKQGTKGNKYSVIPLRRKTLSAATNLGEQMMAMELQQGLKAGRNRAGDTANLTKIQMTPSGLPMEGNVGRVGGNIHKNLKGTVKIQKAYNGSTQSTYITFRTVSSKSDPNKWIHPGYKGAHIFNDLETWAESEVNRVISSYLSK